MSISTLTLNEYFTKSIVLGTSIEKIEKPVSNQVLINYWKNYLSINRKYLPGWTELAKLSKLEGDIFGSRSALYEAKKINPNSPLVIELENSFKTNK